MHALNLRRASERAGSEAEEGNEEDAQLAAALEKAANQRAKRKAEFEQRKILFVHVRLNRVHCRVTYQVLQPSLRNAEANSKSPEIYIRLPP